MFIFNSGKMEKKIVGMKIMSCERCKKNTTHDFIEVASFISAMDKKIAPYRKKHLVICRQCNAANEYTRKDFYQQLSYREDTGYYDDQEQQLKFCLKCGAEFRHDARFCNKCGEKRK